MKARPYWVLRIEEAWTKRPIVWLSGVRRVGKTTLAQMLSSEAYLNCDLPSASRRLDDPESFYDELEPGSRVVLDEVHRLEDPSRVLKIAADAYPSVKLLATGTSTLAATRKFRDALTGRKLAVHLPPVLWSECIGDFDVRNLDRRLLAGGLPEPLLAEDRDATFYSEWIDSFYARDVQELFGIRNRTGFLNLLRILCRQSGSLLDFTSVAKLCGLSRPTVKAHVEALTIAHAAFLLPPFHGGGRREITRRPKAYAFDTGFVAHSRGWESIRSEDRGLLWEHLVLDMLRTQFVDRDLFYWRDKSQREVDFVIRRPGNRADAIECKVNPDRFQAKSLAAFRALYPAGKNLVLSPSVKIPYTKRYQDLTVRFTSRLG